MKSTLFRLASIAGLNAPRARHRIDTPSIPAETYSDPLTVLENVLAPLPASGKADYLLLASMKGADKHLNTPERLSHTETTYSVRNAAGTAASAQKYTIIDPRGFSVLSREA